MGAVGRLLNAFLTHVGDCPQCRDRWLLEKGEWCERGRPLHDAAEEILERELPAEEAP